MENTKHQYYPVNDYEEIDLRELILEIWANKWVICFITLAFILIAGIYSFFIADPVYQANVTIELSNLEGLYSNPANITRYLKSNSLSLPVMRALGYDYSEAGVQKYIANSLTVESSSNSRIIDIKLRNHDPQMARGILEGIVNALKVEAEREYELKIGKLQKDLAYIEMELEDIVKKIADINGEIELIASSSLDATEKSILITGLSGF